MITDQKPTSAKATPTATEAERRAAAQPDILAVLHRIDRLLTEIRAAVDTATREQRHKQFSPLRWVGAILEVIVFGLIALAGLDWIFGAASSGLLVKLAFAAVLQLGALTALVVAQFRR